MQHKKKLEQNEINELITKLKERFEKHMNRHRGIEWSEIEKKLLNNSEKLWSISEMERSEGEPDLVELSKGEYYFVDCSEQSPKGRRSICFDQIALEDRKANKPANSALNMAEEMGIEILNETEYKSLQEFGDFDTTTSSWIETPSKIRELGGALFGDKRYKHVFIYHNGADSYYAARGFRGKVRV